MVSGSLSLLNFYFEKKHFIGLHEGKQGSGPDRGQRPAEWGDFLFVCLSVCIGGQLGPPMVPGGQFGTPGDK